jgi:hypothetical protein
MAARESSQIIEEERERVDSPTPLLEVLRRAYGGPSGGGCSAAELLLIGLVLGSSPVAHSGKFAQPRSSTREHIGLRSASFGYDLEGTLEFLRIDRRASELLRLRAN